TDINIVGSELTAANLLNLSAGRDINLLAGTGSSLDRSETTRERVGIEVTTDSNGINAFAGREVHTVNDELDNQTLQASILQAGNRVQLAADNNLKQVSSDVAAGNDVIYQAGNDIMLDAALAYETSTHSETTRRDGISVSLSHNYETTRQAVKNAGEGDNDVSRTSSTLQAIDSVNNFLSGPTASGFAGTSITYQRAMESTGVARSSTLQAGGDIQLVASNDIDIRGSQLFAGNDMQLAAENVRILSVDNRFQQAGESRFERAGFVANAGKNSASIGVGANFNEQLSDYDAAGAQISYLHAGNNLAINANTDILVGSSDLDATNDISLTAGRDVMLIAQAFDSNYDEQGKSWGAEVGVAATVSEGGPALGVYGSAQLGDNELRRDGTSYRNSHLTAGNNLAIKSGRDTRVTGATGDADNLSMDVGRDLTVASVQDIEQADGRRRDVSGRVVGGAGASVSLSVGYGETEGDKDWVTEQTRLVGRNSVDIRVEEHTQLDGALIANIDENGVDQGNLRLDTGTLAFNDIKDRHQETSYYLNVGITTSDEKGNNPNQQEGNRQTGMATLSGQKANGDGSTGFTISGYHSETDRSQINRAT
ncbi:MAG: hemagglutinin repeat-containing protein, partial [Pseudomonadota bacterium]|nr:hemagglutinin repeat-containing protein [Pseudomonadota bacterium]